MSGSTKLQDQTGTPFGVRRLDTDSETLKDNTPVVALSTDDGSDVSADTPLPVYTVNTEKTEGTRTSAHVSDDQAISLLSEILLELKRMNIHLGIVTCEVIDNQEIE